MRSLLLRAAATALTLAVAVLSARHVAAHLRDPAAPLHPPVVSAGTGPLPAGSGGSLQLTPDVRTTDLPPATSTYVS
ncbi:MAG TPA: hypothetical protein VFD01_09050 [Candidatus Dormibacteraeota bacterium]|nr:hypothetical protein [Candidatus Dormibacteraeota bacterium]